MRLRIVAFGLSAVELFSSSFAFPSGTVARLNWFKLLRKKSRFVNRTLVYETSVQFSKATITAATEMEGRLCHVERPFSAPYDPCRLGEFVRRIRARLCFLRLAL